MIRVRPSLVTWILAIGAVFFTMAAVLKPLLTSPPPAYQTTAASQPLKTAASQGLQLSTLATDQRQAQAQVYAAWRQRVILDAKVKAAKIAKAKLLAAQAAAQQAATAPPVVTGTGWTAAALEHLWTSQGGAASAAATAACIAIHESGNGTDVANPGATGAAGEEGLWQINPVNNGLVIGSFTVEATHDPAGNARDAIALSHDGSDWGPWTTRFMCGV